MKKYLERLAACLMALCLFAGSAYADGFDMDVFRKQTTPGDDSKHQYSVSIDDMEARGFISMNYSSKYNDSGDTYNFYNLDMYLYVCEPDIYLANYGTSKFFPVPRVWVTYYGAELYTYDAAIFKIGDTTYRFDDVFVSNDTSNLTDECRFKSKIACICSADYTDFMDAWIANGTASIAVRLKGRNANTSDVDFSFPAHAQANTLLMFQNFKDAGGYALLPAI